MIATRSFSAAILQNARNWRGRLDFQPSVFRTSATQRAAFTTNFRLLKAAIPARNTQSQSIGLNLYGSRSALCSAISPLSADDPGVQVVPDTEENFDDEAQKALEALYLEDDATETAGERLPATNTKVKANRKRKDPQSTTTTATGRNRHRVAVLWDLDNKPPKVMSPYNTAMAIRKIGEKFGSVEKMWAFANGNPFKGPPAWVLYQREMESRNMERNDMLKSIEQNGMGADLDWGFPPGWEDDSMDLGLDFEDEGEGLGNQQPKELRCDVCGQKMKAKKGRTAVQVYRKHFKQLHERQQHKNKIHLQHRKVGRKQQPNELMQELQRAKVKVQALGNKKQSADKALREKFKSLVTYGSNKQVTNCLVLVSDDSDFVSILEKARNERIRTVVIGSKASGKLRSKANFSVMWADIQDHDLEDEETMEKEYDIVKSLKLRNK